MLNYQKPFVIRQPQLTRVLEFAMLKTEFVIQKTKDAYKQLVLLSSYGALCPHDEKILKLFEEHAILHYFDISF